MLNCNRKEKQIQINMVCIEDLVPKDHILRDIDKVIISASSEREDINKLRCKTIKRVLADTKEKHAMRYTVQRVGKA